MIDRWLGLCLLALWASAQPLAVHAPVPGGIAVIDLGAGRKWIRNCFCAATASH